jgi:polysaccharide biosynthesis/export protein
MTLSILETLSIRQSIFVLCALVATATGAAAQSAPAGQVQNRASAAGAAETAGAGAAAVVPADYVIGPEDQLTIVFYRDKDMSADVVVRPDGKISLPLLNDVQASGLTPDQLRQKVSLEAKRFVQDPNATVVVRQINSRKVFITGAVERPGTFPLIGPTTVLQLIATAGGIKEYADGRKILIIRKEGGAQSTFSFNYKDVVTGKNMQQNIELRPGDTIVVP